MIFETFSIKILALTSNAFRSMIECIDTIAMKIV